MVNTPQNALICYIYLGPPVVVVLFCKDNYETFMDYCSFFGDDDCFVQ